jgi:excisionase family DNA binding protein
MAGRSGPPVATREVQPEWLTYREAETLSGLSRTTLWRLVTQEEEIRAAHVGRAVRINRESLSAYMRRSAENPPAGTK